MKSERYKSQNCLAEYQSKRIHSFIRVVKVEPDDEIAIFSIII